MDHRTNLAKFKNIKKNLQSKKKLNSIKFTGQLSGRKTSEIVNLTAGSTTYPTLEAQL